MTPQEAKHAKVTSRIVRAGRKLRGKSQRDLASLLGVSQSAVSLMEHAESIPSASQWYDLCEILELDPESCFKLGIIDGCTPASLKDTGRESGFRIPARYFRHHGSTIRTTQWFLKYFRAAIGQNALDGFIKERKIDPDLFCVYDHPINTRLSLDLAEILIRKGFLGHNTLHQLTAPLSEPTMHGNLHPLYQTTATQADLMECLISNVTQYDVNYEYRLEERKGNQMILSAEATPVLGYFQHRSGVLGDFLVQYRASFLRSFSTMNGQRPAEVEVLELNVKRGLERCLYQVTTH